MRQCFWRIATAWAKGIPVNKNSWCLQLGDQQGVFGNRKVMDESAISKQPVTTEDTISKQSYLTHGTGTALGFETQKSSFIYMFARHMGQKSVSGKTASLDPSRAG